MEEAKHKYTMVISRTTIDKLGIKLYDRVAAVLAELVANSYDADAEHITIKAPLGVFLDSESDFEIVVEDDGHGMTFDEVNAFYLRVGTDRRLDSRRGDESREKHRKVMGRKGIGKLAPFGICREVEVITAGGELTDKGYPVSNLILRLDGILQDVDEEYHPEVGELDGSFKEKRGTIVKLRDFIHRRVPNSESLHRQLAARFGIARPDWSISVIDTACPGAEPVTIGDLAIEIMENTKIDVDGRPVPLPDEAMLPVTGWIAYAKRPYKDEEMAGVRVYARGKIVAQTRDFGLGAGFTGEYKLRSYVVGAINADWLDDEEDLIRSDRQDILWNSEYGQAFRKWGQDLLRELAKKGESSVRNQNWISFKEKSDIERRAAESFKGAPEVREHVISAARALVSRADPSAVEDKDYVESLTQLAFVVGPHRTLLDKLHEVSATTSSTFETIVELFKSACVAELYSLGQIARERVGAIRKLEQLIVSSQTEERELQELIERAPWLIAPDWTPLTQNETLERLRTAFETWYWQTRGSRVTTTTIGNANKRPDFVLVNQRGCLHIVEIKRPGHAITDSEYERVQEYLEAVLEFIHANPVFKEEFRKVNVTLVCDEVNLQRSIFRSHYKAFINDGVLIRRTWLEFLDSTKLAHESFLEAVKGKEWTDE